jgi:hypothetical protein
MTNTGTVDTAEDAALTAYRQQMDAAGVALSEKRSLDSHWHCGVATGLLYGMQLAPGMTEFAVRLVAEHRPDATPGATDAMTALEGCYSLDPIWRERIVRASGVLQGWAIATIERGDAKACATCGARVCVDIEEHFACEVAEHGVFCSVGCQKDMRCGGTACVTS